MKSIYKFEGNSKIIDIKIDDKLYILRNNNNDDNTMIIEEYSLLIGTKTEDISIDMKCESSLLISNNRDEKLLLLCLNDKNDLIIIDSKKEEENKIIKLNNLNENNKYKLERIISSCDNNRLYNYFKIISNNNNEIENIGYLNNNNNTIDISNTIKGNCSFTSKSICCLNNESNGIIMIISYKTDGFEEIERKELYFKTNNEKENKLFIVNDNDKILIQLYDKTIYYIIKNEIKWNREDGLSYIKELEIMERNENENINNEIININFVRRMKDEINEVKEMIINEIDWIRNGFKMQNLKEFEESNKYFGFNKYIVALSEFNILYLLSSDNGKLLYKYDLIGNSHLLFKDENSINIISEMDNNVIYIYTFIPSIQSLSHTILPVNSKIEKKIRFPVVNNNNNNPTYGFIFNDLNVKIFPESENEIEYYYVDINKNSKIIKGYIIKGNAKDKIRSKLLYKIDLSYEEGEIIKYVIPNYSI